MLKTTLIFLLLLPSIGFSQIKVKALQPPVWKEVNGERQALFAGDSVDENIIIISGKDARVLLDMSEGSAMELGELMQFNTPTVDNSSQLFKATVNILRGAFRFTTSKFAGNRARELSINLPSSTIGIRGTDLWGSADPNKDFVVLLEGSIEIENKDGQIFNLDQSLSVYQTQADSSPLPLSTAAMSDVLALAPETAIIPDRAVIKHNSDFVLILGSYQLKDNALKSASRIQQQGYPASVKQVDINNETYHRVVIESFSKLDDAREVFESLYQQQLVSSNWIAPLIQ